jgi:hypothetical protein
VPIKERFDLKGSTRGRFASEKELAKGGQVRGLLYGMVVVTMMMMMMMMMMIMKEEERRRRMRMIMMIMMIMIMMIDDDDDDNEHMMNAGDPQGRGLCGPRAEALLRRRGGQGRLPQK